MGYSGIVEPIREALNLASDAEREIVALVYGFDGPPCKTEEIAKQRGRTPQEIDEVARSVVRRMRRPAVAELIRGALVNADARIWSALAGASGVLRKTEPLAVARQRLPGELDFAIDCLYGTVEQWLAANARNAARAWYRCPYAEEEIDRLVRQFSAGADQLLLPVPLDFLASQLDAEVPAIETAVRLTGECRLFSGYVARMPLGTRAPRAIRLHRILSGGRVGEVAPARQLLELYRSEFADDACTLFDVEATMSSFPHLFLRLGDLGWARIGAAGSRKTAPEGSGEDEVGFHRWSDERRSLNQARNRELLLQILKEHGLGGIPKIARLLTMKCGNQFSVASATACLYSSGDFVHYAPGIYGLFDETWHVCRDPEARKLLLNRRACIEYILARWAGEPAGAYPLWTPEMEVDWCEWAESRAKPLLGSLLAVVDPSSWPISESYRNIWLWKKECWEYYRFETPPSYPLAEVPLIGLLAVLRCARWRGGLNWVLASRVTGDSIIRRATAAYMALLIGVEAIVPAAHWQRWHNVSPEAGAIDSMLSDELRRKGSLGWDGAAGQDLLKRLEKSMDRRETGWLPGPELHRLIVTHTSKAAATPSK